MDSPICLWAPHFLLFLFIYLFIISYFYRVPLITLWGLLPFAVEIFPFSLLGSSPSHSPSHCLIGLQHGALSHRTQVRGYSPSSHGGPLPATIRGLSSILVARLSPFLSGGSPALPGAHPHLVHLTVGLPHISVGLPHIAVGLFTISSWGFVSLWGSSPSHSLNCGASPHLCGALPHLAHSTVGPTQHLCGALHHLSVGLHLAVGLFPISLTQLWGFSTSLCGSLSPLSVGLPFTEGLFPLSLT